MAEYDKLVNDVGDFRGLADKAKNNEQMISSLLEQAKKDKDVFAGFIEKLIPERRC